MPPDDIISDVSIVEPRPVEPAPAGPPDVSDIAVEPGAQAPEDQPEEPEQETPTPDALPGTMDWIGPWRAELTETIDAATSEIRASVENLQTELGSLFEQGSIGDIAKLDAVMNSFRAGVDEAVTGYQSAVANLMANFGAGFEPGGGDVPPPGAQPPEGADDAGESDAPPVRTFATGAAVQTGADADPEDAIDGPGGVWDRPDHEDHYDDDGNLVLQVRYGPGDVVDSVTTFDYDDEGELQSKTTFTYDADGNPTGSTIVDAEDRVIEGTFVNDDGETESVTYEYDDVGNLVRESKFDADGAEVSRVDVEVLPDGTAETETTTWSYADNGDLQFIMVDFVDGDGLRTQSTYDDSGNELERIDYDVEGNIDLTTRWAYDDDGNVAEAAVFGPDGERMDDETPDDPETLADEDVEDKQPRTHERPEPVDLDDLDLRGGEGDDDDDTDDGDDTDDDDGRVVPPQPVDDGDWRPGAMAYVLQGAELGETKEEAVAALRDSGRDFMVLDASDPEMAWTAEDIAEIRGGQEGRTIISYLSIGEAETYRDYWKPEWDANNDGTPDESAPDWLRAENENWDGNYRVEYWDPEWQAMIFSYLEDIKAAGYDGVYLDIVDAFQDYPDDGNAVNPDTGNTYREDMILFVSKIAEIGRSGEGNEDFRIIPQNGEELLESPEYRSVISGIGVEELYTVYNTDTGESEPQDPEHTQDALDYLKLLQAEGKPAFVIEYCTDPGQQDDARESADRDDVNLLITNRDLTDLGTATPAGEPTPAPVEPPVAPPVEPPVQPAGPTPTPVEPPPAQPPTQPVEPPVSPPVQPAGPTPTLVEPLVQPTGPAPAPTFPPPVDLPGWAQDWSAHIASNLDAAQTQIQANLDGLRAELGNLVGRMDPGAAPNIDSALADFQATIAQTLGRLTPPIFGPRV